MKVSDGFWLTKNGYSVNWASQIYEAEADERSVTVYAATNFISNKGMTLGGPVLTIRFTSTLENSIKVNITHFAGAGAKKPVLPLNEDSAFCPTVKKYKGGYKLISGRTSVTVGKIGREWDISYHYGGRLLTKSGWRTTSLITEEEWHRQMTSREQAAEQFFSRSDSGGGSFVREMLNIAVGEYIYGFGEKFTPFVKNGQTVEVWNDDGGTCTEQSYKSVPFFISSRGYGVFVNHTEKVSFEVGSENVSKTAFSVQGESLEYFIFGGDTAADVIERYTALTGRPALPPPWSFGLWLSTSFTTDYDEETVTSFISEMKRRDIPLDVFHFDCFWMKEFEWCGFEWDKRKFPDPAAMLARLKEMGLKICVWINPYIGQRSPAFAECAEKGYFIKNRDGSVFQCDMWQPGMAVIDFTNPDAREWFAAKIRALADMGVDAVKTDFGERIPTDVQYHDGSDPFKMHNYYSYLYNKTAFEALESAKGKGNACLFARSATAGCQQFPVHWGGDCFSNYESMGETLRGGLSLCLSGFGFFSHDIGGFESTGTPDLYKRWTAFGLMSSHSRYHGNSSYRVPWHFDEESCDVSRHFVKLKGRLMPYIWANAVKTHLTGVPVMRAMMMDFGYDRSTLTVDTQYMLGDSLLVAPVFSEDGECSFYLPDCGIWTDIQTGEELHGGKWYTRKYDYFGMPLFAKPRSVIVYGDHHDTADYDYISNMRIVVYGIEDGGSCETTVYGRDISESVHIKATRSGNVIRLSVRGTDKPFTAESSQGLEIRT
ncbi:MAG: alpha-xylosidase [Ruminococcus sp.]|uniref:alpha-xylosidase n=1 Tax=Ruminococcus sp. TaxID=41978 RepID=UPI0025EB3D9B|nr:alpha-xylosidase [Ruminococcus sp.]MCR5600523.1 alpha-xylosidase [Ruminococcus sp.]